MIAAHLTNGMTKTDDPETTKAKARDKAKEYRARGIYAIILPDDETKKYSVFVPVGATLSLF
jgi:hypothetical protein